MVIFKESSELTHLGSSYDFEVYGDNTFKTKKEFKANSGMIDRHVSNAIGREERLVEFIRSNSNKLGLDKSTTYIDVKMSDGKIYATYTGDNDSVNLYLIECSITGKKYIGKEPLPARVYQYPKEPEVWEDVKVEYKAETPKKGVFLSKFYYES